MAEKKERAKTEEKEGVVVCCRVRPLGSGEGDRPFNANTTNNTNETQDNTNKRCLRIHNDKTMPCFDLFRFDRSTKNEGGDSFGGL